MKLAGGLADIAFVGIMHLEAVSVVQRSDADARPGSKKIRSGDRDAELAHRAARRIGEYLTTHPGADPVTIQGELAGDDALVIPRAAAVLLAQVLGYLANDECVTVMPDSAELTTQQAAEF